MTSKSDGLHHGARLCYLVMMLEKRGPGRPRKKEFDTADLAVKLGVTQRSIQRDLHEAQQVRELLKNQGGTTFTVCDDCWDKHNPKPCGKKRTNG